MSDDHSAALAEALKRLQEHLRSVHRKQTPEREAILDIIYRTEMLIDPMTLHQQVCRQHSVISLASVYNTLQLLSELRLVRKIQIPDSDQVFYERSLGNPPHPYAVCPHCKTVWTLPEEGVVAQLEQSLPSKYKPFDYILLVTGICSKCEQAEKKRALEAEKAFAEALAARKKKQEQARKRKNRTARGAKGKKSLTRRENDNKI